MKKLIVLMEVVVKSLFLIFFDHSHMKLFCLNLFSTCTEMDGTRLNRKDLNLTKKMMSSWVEEKQNLF